MNQNEPGNFAPTDLITSKLRFYSVGIVAQNKALNSQEIEVTPVEELTMLDGEITATPKDYKAGATDNLGKTYQSTVVTKVSIKASWLRFGDANRLTAPDVRRGEGVMIFQFGDADKYYWMTLKQDSNLRKLETVVWAISATKNEADKTDATHSYYLEVSSHKKLVHFHTSKADGEPYSYDVQINTKDGYITIADDIGNFFHLNSRESRLEMKNVDGSHYDMHKGVLDITTPESININTKSFKLSSSSSSFSSSGTTSMTGGGSVTISSPATSIN